MASQQKSVGESVFWILCAVGLFAILSLTMSKTPVLKPFSLSLGTPTDWTGVVAAASTVPGILVSLPATSLSDIFGRKRFLLMAGNLPEVIHFNLFLTGVIVTSIIDVAIFARPYMGRVSDKIGRRIPIAAGCMVSGLPLLAIPFVADFWVLLSLAVVYGFGFAAVTASTSALVSELVPKELVGTSMGFLDTVVDVGQTLGPVISGFTLATNLQYYGVFPSLALVLLFSCIIFVLSGTAKGERDRRLVSLI